MREDVQEIFVKTKHNKQVCMFSATMTEESRAICKKFMRSVNNCINILFLATWNFHRWSKEVNSSWFSPIL